MLEIENKCRELAKEKGIQIRRSRFITVSYMDGAFNGKQKFNTWEAVLRFLENYKRD